MLYLDLDRFKAVNDSMGHAAGDELLRSVADRLRSVVRSGDLPARLGGDEFAILMTGPASPQDAAALAERIIAVVGASYDLPGGSANIGVSIGIAMSTGSHEDPTALLARADRALYEAKRSGRGTWRTVDHGELDLAA